MIRMSSKPEMESVHQVSKLTFIICVFRLSYLPTLVGGFYTTTACFSEDTEAGCLASAPEYVRQLPIFNHDNTVIPPWLWPQALMPGAFVKVWGKLVCFAIGQKDGTIKKVSFSTSFFLYRI
jgi:hypothetical protein